MLRYTAIVQRSPKHATISIQLNDRTAAGMEIWVRGIKHTVISCTPN